MQLSEVRTLTTALLGGSTNLSNARLDDLINQGIRAIVAAVPSPLLPTGVLRQEANTRITLNKNTSFETFAGGEPQSWAFKAGGDTIVAKAPEVSSATARTGNISIRFPAQGEHHDSNRPYMYSSVITSGISATAYKLSLWILEDETDALEIEATVVFRNAAGAVLATLPDGGTQTIAVAANSTSPTWIQKELSVSAAALSSPVTATIFIRSSSTPGNRKELFLDDVEFYLSSVSNTEPIEVEVPSDAVDPGPVAVIVDGKAARRLPLNRLGDLHLSDGAARTNSNSYLDAANDQLYVQHGRTLYVTPNNASNIDIVYSAMPAALSGDTDLIPLPMDLLPALPAYVAWHARLADGELEEAQLHQADYTGIVGNYVNADMPRPAGAPQ